MRSSPDWLKKGMDRTMTTAKLIWAAVHVVMGAALLIACKRTGALIKNLLICSVLGLLALTLVVLTAGYTQLNLEFNPYTVSTSVILGLPGVIMLLLLNLLFR